ncbi:hypothetical protein EMCG_04884 [[Emmonsia] crescens]|uniref:STEEP1 domain-containing protein n=1 Tax=[Emmonsia] crescens TaxID=73230 RepID=A0A0G2IY89_9EURO|nr:hypothetical protein EMCG_04884 [Emmonsia crescens UAMH 3008]
MAMTGDDKSAAAAKSLSPPTQIPPAAVSQSQSQSPNPAANANAELQQVPQTRLPIKTYHCAFCNHLLLASTCDLSSLPRRREPARDRALILPLPKDSQGEEEEEEETESEAENGSEATEAEDKINNAQQNRDKPRTKSKTKRKTKPEPTQQQQEQQHYYTILLSTTIPDRKPTMIRREDGFEKRLLLRCGRCRVVMGYALDDVHFADHKFGTGARAGAGGEGGGEGEREKEDDEGQEEEEEEEERRRRSKKAEEVVYLLPGALVETGEMGKGDNRVETEEWARWEKGSK